MNNYNEFSANSDIKKAQMPVCEKNVCQELSGEFSLPDYKSEIRRLLRVEASVTPPMRYVGGSNVKFSGNINYNVLYVGSEGALNSITLTDEYEISAPIQLDGKSDLGEGVIAFGDITPESVTSRVAAPRKLIIRTRLCADITAYSSSAMGEMLYGEVDPSSIQRREEKVSTMASLVGVAEPFECSCELSLPHGEGEPRIISARANAYIDEAVAESGACHYRGNALLKLLVAREGSDEIVTLERKLPFEDTLEMDGADAGFSATAHAKCSDIKTSISDDGRILCDVTVEAEAAAQKNLDLAYTTDIFSTEKQNTAEYIELLIPSSLGCFNANFSHSASDTISNLNVDSSASIIDVTGSASVSGVSVEKGKCVLSGEGRYNVLFRMGDEYSTAEVTSPFRYEFDGEEASEVAVSADVELIPARARFDGEKLTVDGEAYLSCRSSCKRRARMLESATFEGDISRERGEITVAYPAEDESLWDVAKRYRVGVARTAAKNGISADNYTLDGVKYLVV